MTDPACGRPAVFVDRDGVINEPVPDSSGKPESPLAAQDVILIDGATDALTWLRAAGFMLVGVSNQPAAAKGTVSLPDLLGVQERVAALLNDRGVTFDAFELCLHHPEGVIPELSGPCSCRKPAPGMLLSAARRLNVSLARSWMVGDTDSDIAAGRSAGCRTILVEHPGSAHKRLDDASPTALAADLMGAAEIILSDTKSG